MSNNKSTNNIKPQASSFSAPATQVILNSFITSQKSKDKIISSAIIQEGSIAEVVARNIFQEILNYQAIIPDENEDVAITLVSFNQEITIEVFSVGYIGYNLITFVGTDNSGKPRELIQNVSQVNVLLTTTLKRDPSAPRREIGFRAT